MILDQICWEVFENITGVRFLRHTVEYIYIYNYIFRSIYIIQAAAKTCTQ